MLKATYSHIFKYLERQTGYLLVLLVYPTTPHTSIKQVHNYTHIIWWARWFQEETNRFPRTKAGHQNGHQITSKPNCYTTGLEAFRAWVKGSHDRTMHKLHKLVIFICKRSGSKKKKNMYENQYSLQSEVVKWMYSQPLQGVSRFFHLKNIGNRCSFGRSVVRVISWCQVIKPNHLVRTWYWIGTTEEKLIWWIKTLEWKR